jgi:hypothetical protein
MNAYKFSIGKSEGKRLLGGPRCRWEDNVKMDLKEVGGREWTGSGAGYGLVAGSCEHGVK